MAKNYDTHAVAEAVMKNLKDFQKDTVNHVIELYRNGHNRVLVADEVGLGKTVVARGVIAKFAELRESEDDDLVKVAYICANQNIAAQNVQKLKVSASVSTDLNPSEARLSMQHLRITEQENNPDIRNGYVQIIPLTPETSFRMTNGLGLRQERALMFVILSRMIAGSDISERKLRNRLYGPQYSRKATDDSLWDASIADFKKRVEECEALTKDTKDEYPANIISRLRERGALDEVEALIAEKEVTNGDPHIRQLRQWFAEESAAMLKPDLVIMDEFQRFRFLLDSNPDCETGILAGRFLKVDPKGDSEQKVRVLLLSATPYKPYSTSAEIAETGVDDEFLEFMELLRFLFEGDSGKAVVTWEDYTKEFRRAGFQPDKLRKLKQQAEDVLSQAICRTERISVMDDGDYMSDDGAKQEMNISVGDIKGFIEFQRILTKLDLGVHLPVDYVKSCPYLMSYLKGYQLKEKIERSFKRHKRSLVELLNRKCLWLNWNTINNYKELPKCNARLETLKGHAFQGKSALYMWVPPTLPYYSPQGVYKDSCLGENRFSKVLVFSAWEMVPRMISTLMSYEAERRIVANGEHYKSKHSQRLKEQVDGKMTVGYEALVKPVDIEWLAGLWDPIDTKNRGLELGEIEKEVRAKIRATRDDLNGDEIQVLVDKVLGSPAVCIARRIGCTDDKARERVTRIAQAFWTRFNNFIGTSIVDRTYPRRDDESHWRNILSYCKDGCFQAMFDEYFAVLRDDVSFMEGDSQLDEIVRKMEEALTLRVATYEVDTYRALESRIYVERGGSNDGAGMEMRTHFAACFAKGKSEDTGGVNRKEVLRKSFNSPMRPFVLASTSIGQEGLDFHPYCRKILHWNLPSNPIDIEQREGRINRYKCLAVRENAALKYGNIVFKDDVWDEIYSVAAQDVDRAHVPELVPFWCFGENQSVKIERIVPKYPCSRDAELYNRLINILALYRLSMGQPRQEEIIEQLMKQCKPEDWKQLKNLFINLSPYMRKHFYGRVKLQ